MGFSTLVRICNLRYFFALGNFAKVMKASKNHFCKEEALDFSLESRLWTRSGMIYRVQFVQWLPVSVEKAFLFFANPNNLPRIMPPASGTELVELRLALPPNAPADQPAFPNLDSLAGIGSEIVTSFRPIPFLRLRAQWIALITEFEWNHHFADIQKKGPFKQFRHRHEFSRETINRANGTTIRDVIEYDPGFSVLGNLASKAFIAPSIKQTFEYRQRMLEKLVL